MEGLLAMLEIPPEEEMGDLALPCFGLAKKMHRNPGLLAAGIAEKLNAQREALWSKFMGSSLKCYLVARSCLYISRSVSLNTLNMIRSMESPCVFRNAVTVSKAICAALSFGK